MEKKFKSLSIAHFLSKFGTENDCFEHLVQLKWGNKYACGHCGNKKYCKAVRLYDRQCSRCSYIESPTSGTIFHKIKFSLVKAFQIVYFLATNKKGISSCQLARTLQLRQKTCWLFKQKIMRAMESTNRHPLEGNVEIVEFEIGHISKKEDRELKDTTQKVLIAIEKKSLGASRIYATELQDLGVDICRKFILKKVSLDATIHAIDKSPFNNLKSEGLMVELFDSSNTKMNYSTSKRVVTCLKNWITTIHCNVKYLQQYLDEYCYRHNRHLMKEEIIDDLLGRMVRHKPTPYKTFIV
ncbi:MAG: IS1595 family transposase [Saprospiraceae bacterium]|nr:IS1595 family transposase [Candidatus Brachybacter algidus]MBK8746665.1 IS1595 family transposase [Candidatus Brachybacter algidus]